MTSEFLHTLVLALGLMLVLEGVGPFVVPDIWRRYVSQAASMNNNALRLLGLLLMVVGLIIVRLLA